MSDPIYFTVWDDLWTRLGNMRRAEGYQLDYGAVQEGRSHGVHDSDFARPKIGVRWIGELFEHPVHGGNMASHTIQRLAQFEITIPARLPRGGQDDNTKRAMRILTDVHKAVMGATSTETSSAVRTRGLDNTATWETDVRWLDTDEAGQPIGGTLLVVYTTAFNHATGDLTAVR